MTRADDIHEFLTSTGWAKATRAPLAGDAGNRRYERLADSANNKAVLMDADPAMGEDVRPFLKIAAHLTSCGLAAPKIFSQNAEQGLILMQDFGDGLLFTLAEQSPDLELGLYRLALAALDQLHKTAPPTGVGQYMADDMAKGAEITLAWYCNQELAAAIAAELRMQLQNLDWSDPVLVLRDYHAQNLIYRPEETGLDQMGQLDFQDARLGHPLYDAASLIHDARRSLTPTVAHQLKQELAANYQRTDTFEHAFSTLSAQRNLRVLALFARLCLRDGKPGYLDLMPHVWDNLWRDLSHPDLVALAKICANLPPPSQGLRSKLRAKCATRPTN
jgi:aminoglycoside/choline kinase family phosphotransferase